MHDIFINNIMDIIGMIVRRSASSGGKCILLIRKLSNSRLELHFKFLNENS